MGIYSLEYKKTKRSPHEKTIDINRSGFLGWLCNYR